MNEKFDNALSIANNLAGHAGMQLTALTYQVALNGGFTASFQDMAGYSYVYIADKPIDVLLQEIKDNYEYDSES